MSTPVSKTPGAVLGAAWIIGLATIGPLFFPLDWAFHVLPDKFAAIEYMRRVGDLPKAVWTLCGPLGIATIILLLRRSLAGLFACILFAAIYVPTAMRLWAQFSFGCWAVIAAVFVAAYGVVTARRLS